MQESQLEHTSTDGSTTAQGGSGGSRVREIKRKMVADVDGAYIQSFINDARDHIANTQREYQGLTWKNARSEEVNVSRADASANMNQRARKVRTYLDAYKEDIPEEQYTALKQYLDDFDAFQNQSAASFRNAYAQFSQFETEDDYRAFTTFQKQLGEDIPAIDQQIADLEAEYETFDWTDASQREKMREYESKISQMKVYRRQAAAVQANKAAQDDLEKRIATYSKNADWDKLSKGIDVSADPDRKSDYSIVFELSRTNVAYDKETALANGTPEAEWNDIDQKRRYIGKKYGVDLYADIYDNVNIFNEIMSMLDDYSFEGGELSQQLWGERIGNSFKNMRHLTEDEQAVLNYIFHTQGRDAALQWHNSRMNIYQDRANGVLTEEMLNWGKEAPIRSSLASVAMSLGSGFEQIGDWISGDYNNSLARASSAIRSGVSEKTDLMIGNWDAFDFLYSTGMSGVDSWAASAFGKAGSVVLGLSAAAQATNDAMDRGMPKKQAFWHGLMSGVFECLFERWSIGNFKALKEVESEYFKDAVKNLAKTMLVNATEEACTEVANIAYDTIVNGDFSQYEAMLLQNVTDGMSEHEAKRNTALQLGGQVAEAAASGALMGFGFGVTGLSQGALKKASRKVRFNKALKNFENTQLKEFAPQIIAEALDLNPDNAQAMQLKAQLDGGKELSTGDLKSLRTLAKESTIAVDSETAASRLKELGETGDVAAISKAAAKQAVGEKLTAAEKKILSQSQHAQQVVEELTKQQEAVFDTAETQPITAQQTNSADTDSMSTPAENVPETQYEVSVDNQTIQKSTGEAITIQKISSIKNGKMTFRTDAGTEVDAADVSYASKDEAIVYETVAQLCSNASAANLLVDAFHTGQVPGDIYARGIQEAYSYGKFNISQDDMMKHGSYVKDLTEHQRNVAYKMGQLFAGEQISREVAAIRKRKKSGKKVAGKVHFDGDRSKLNATQLAGLDAMELLAKGLGIQFYVFESDYNADGDRVGKSGWYDPKDGSIHIDLYAGNDGKGTILFTVAHELTHYIHQWSPAKFKILANYLIKQYGEKGVSVNELIDDQITKAALDNRTIDRDEAFEEMVADSMESMLTSGNVLQMMADVKAQDRTLWEKIRDWFKDFAEKLKKIINAYSDVEPDSVEGRLVADMQDVTVILEALYGDALLDAAENFDTEAQKNTAGSGVKYLGRNNKKIPSNQQSAKVGRPVKQGGSNSTHKKMSSAAAAGILGIPNIADATESVKDAIAVLGTFYHSVDSKTSVMGFKKPITGSNLAGSLVAAGVLSRKGNGASAYRKDGEHELRVSNHSAHASNFKGAGEHLSIVLRSDKAINRFLSGANNVIEVVFYKETLDKDSKMLKSLIKDIAQFIVSGEYHDTAGASAYLYSGTEIFQKTASDRMNVDQLQRDSITQSARDPAQQKIQKALEQENAQLKEDVSRLEELLKLQRTVTGGTKFTKTSVEAAARMLKKHANVKRMANTSELAQLLHTFYEAVASDTKPSWDKIKEQARPVVQWLQDHVDLQAERSEYAQTILDQIKGSQIYLDESQRAEAEYRFGSYNDFRKAMFGRITLVNEGSTSLDSWWHAMADQFPDVFNPDTTSTDMPGELYDIIAQLKNADTSRVEYEYNRASIAMDLTRQVYDSYWRVSTLHTVADRAQDKINELRYKHYRQMTELRTEKDATIAQIKADNRAALAAHRAKAEKKQREIVERYRESRKKAVDKVRETAEKRDARAKLQKLILDTVNWISYPKKTDVKCPDLLKKPYAVFLNAIDMSSERLAKGEDPTKKDLRLATAMDSLATVLQRVMDYQNPSLEGTDNELDIGYLDLPAQFIKDLRNITEKVKDTMIEGEYVVNNMSAEEVRKLSQMIRTLNHSIREVSTLNANLRFAKVEALGEDTKMFLGSLGNAEKNSGVADFVQWDNALPYYVFKRFGKGGESIFEELMDAQDKLAFLGKVIFDFQEKTWKGEEAKVWTREVHTIALSDRKSITLTTADAMSIYCLSRRNQGLQHLIGGGIRVIGVQKGVRKAKDSSSHLTIEDIDTISSFLTDRQRAVAEAIQDFMSTVCAEWGNEISMKRFLTKEFTEKFYFPIESDTENLPTKDPAAQQSDLFRLLNISATKPLAPGAKNEVIIRNIFDVFSGHASDMARLNAYGMALLDYMKWLNYRKKSVNSQGQVTVAGVRESMRVAYGDAAFKYVLKLIKDVNGRPSDGGMPSFYTKMVRNAKTASVGNSLRVATLQITSYPRAALVLSPKSLVLGLGKVPNTSLAKKYCGIALWKSYGFYDANISRSIEEQIKGVTNIRQKLIELSLKGAEWGDTITWGALWNACEYEVAATKQYKVGTEDFRQAVGKKLREVVYRTQVVDSILTRSEIMRSKDAKAQELSAFMSESTLSANILMDAAFEFNIEKRRTGSAKVAWQKTGKHVKRSIGVYAVGQIAAALLEALWDAWRDDEDEKFGEKYIKALGENLILDLLPFNKIPILSEVAEVALSLFGVGYFSSDNLSSTALTQTVSAFKAWSDIFNEKSSATVYNALYKSMRAVSSLLGVSFSGVMREGVALWNNTAGAYDSTWKIRKYEPSNASWGDQLYEAIIDGDDRREASLRKKFTDKDGKHDASAERSAIRKALRENDPRIRQAARARIAGDHTTANKLMSQIVEEGFFDYSDISAAVKAEYNDLKTN
ncbi:MAG: hypothetical protein IIV13_00895 [Bacteroidaceae bacterium]|nr:hypothetical protein [Bacteroidaceae bacterium]